MKRSWCWEKTDCLTDVQQGKANCRPPVRGRWCGRVEVLQRDRTGAEGMGASPQDSLAVGERALEH